ncbi:thioredoxin domain-containing protein [Flavobacteriaceae bacterium]|nr:thioredoxin domain-containing protein [Flavobacteriaceae bacterium]
MKAHITLYFMSFLLCIACSKNDSKNTKKGNDLVNETSPYLLQHAYNPVNWKAWNEATLDVAKEQNKLIVVSIGYSSCHWCHVMEEESFENDSIAKIMNDNFINIKVDREERPDVDKVYMNAVQLMTGKGGWPLNCITLPDGRPVFGGTYFTKDQWSKILKDVSKLYQENPQKVEEFAQRVTEGIQTSELITLNKEEAVFKNEDIIAAINQSKGQLDTINGSFIGAPKFPMPNSIDYLLRYQYQFNDPNLAGYIQNSLTKMAYGGIYDQIGGGFSRYSVDDRWHIPHFEKMLYDNAQLVSIYSKAYLQDKNELYKNVVQETLGFVNDELNANNGAFYSSLDADSKNENDELEEGVFYSWTKQELQSLIKEYDLFADYYNVNNFGFWEKDLYVLTRNQSNIEFAKKNNLTNKELNQQKADWKATLTLARNKRNKPNLDDKILTSWNALMLQGYIDAYRAFDDNEYLDKAVKIAEFLVKNQLRDDGGLNRNFKNGKSTINGYAEDYATVIQAFISLHEVTLNEKWLLLSKEIMEYTITHFFDSTSGMFFYTSNEDPNLIARKTEVIDGVISSSNSIIGNNLFKLGHYFSDKKMTKISEQMLNNLKIEITKNPLGYSNWMHLMTNLTQTFYEVAVVGENATTITKELFKKYLPNILISASDKESELPLLEYKYIEGETLIYVCVNGTCKLPLADISKAIKSIKRN